VFEKLKEALERVRRPLYIHEIKVLVGSCKILVANGHVVCLSICNPSLWKVLEIWNHVYKHPLTPPLEG
jgi:hypothetical protein